MATAFDTRVKSNRADLVSREVFAFFFADFELLVAPRRSAINAQRVQFVLRHLYLEPKPTNHIATA